MIGCAVQVVVGNLVYEVGRLQYETVESEGGGAADYWIVGSAVGGGAMLTVILIILVVYKRKSTRAERQFKRLQLQLDSLESNIRNECKQGARALFPSPPAAERNSAHESTLLVCEEKTPNLGCFVPLFSRKDDLEINNIVSFRFFVYKINGMLSTDCIQNC